MWTHPNVNSSGAPIFLLEAVDEVSQPDKLRIWVEIKAVCSGFHYTLLIKITQ